MSVTSIRSKPLAMECSEIMALLSDTTRLAILELLISEPLHVEELNARLKIDPTLLSYHLAKLRNTKLVIGVREGRRIRYEISSTIRKSVASRTLNFGCCKFSFEGRKIVSG